MCTTNLCKKSLRNRFWLIVPDVLLSEALVRELADLFYRLQHKGCGKVDLDLFDPAEDSVFFRLKYTPPEEHFEELRRLIREVYAATGLHSEFHGLLAIDPSAYRGHEKEEYFQILLQYLSDNMTGCQTVFLCSGYSEKEICELQDACTPYFTMNYREWRVFDPMPLKKKLTEEFEEYSMSIDPEALNLMADTLSGPAWRPFRSLQLLQRFPEEMLNQLTQKKCCEQNLLLGESPEDTTLQEYYSFEEMFEGGNYEITLEDVQTFLCYVGSWLSRMTGQALPVEGGM